MNQIAPGRAPILAYGRYYHRPMEGNTPPKGPPRAIQHPAPYNAPQPPPGEGPQAYPYYPPAPAKAGRSLWIIFAGIVIAGALIAGAAFIALSGKDAPPSTANGGPNVTAPASGDAPAAEPAASSTCAAWRSTRSALDAIPGLPAGWNWSTPNIDVYVGNLNAAVTKALDLFEPKIEQAPADVAAVANEYVSARRNEMRMLSEHTYTQADGVAGNVAKGQLDQLCDVAG